MPDPHFAAFEEAIDIWTKFGDQRFSDRKSVVFNKHWRKSPCTLLAYAAHDRKCRFTDHVHEKFGELLNYNEHSSSVLGLFSLTLADASQKDRGSLAERLQCQIQCLIHAVQAGCAWQAYLDSREEQRTARKDEFNAAVRQVIDFYARAYPLSDDCLRENENLWPFVDQYADQPVRRDVLDAALAGVRAGHLISVSGYLAAQHLLEYLVGERAGDDRTGREQFETSGRILARVLSRGPDAPSGQAIEVAFRVSTEAVCGVFLDPIAVGLTPLEDDVFASLHVAWNNEPLSTELSKPQDALPAVRSINIRPELTDPVSLSGRSAGLVFAVGMCAAAHQVKLDPKTTASARLDPENPGRILPVAHESLAGKFAAAKAAGIERIILEAEQAKGFRTHEDAKGLTLIGVSSLAEAWRQWTEKAADQQRMEAILKEYADSKVQEWDQARNDPDDPDGLTHYTERHYSVLPAGTGYDKAHGAPRDAFEPIKADGEEALVRLLQQGRLLCVAEDAGMGKTIFARRLQAFLCSGAASEALGTSGPLVAVYCASDWPTNAAEAVASELRDTLGVQPPTAEAVAQRAVDAERVVLILDALDQVPEAQRENLVRLEKFLHSLQGTKCRVVITTRFAEVPESYKLLFERLKWRFALIEGCIETEQATILGETLYDRLDELIPDPEDVADLLCFPVVLFMIRQFAKDGQLAPFKNRADVYSRATYHMLKEAAPKSRFRFPSDRPLSLQDIPRYEEILARIAFVMMCQGKYDYVVKDPKAAYQIRQQILEVCGDEIDHTSWRMIEIFTDCTNRCILEDVKTTWFGWKHRGMMEYYCGLFLAKYAKPENSALLRPFANDPQWNWAWRFAIELPRGVPRVATWCCSLGVLFEQPADGTRPTELMYRA